MDTEIICSISIKMVSDCHRVHVIPVFALSGFSFILSYCYSRSMFFLVQRDESYIVIYVLVFGYDSGQIL